VLDGVFARGEDGRLRFHGARELDAADVADVLAAITPGVQRVLARRGGDPEDAHDGSDAFADASPLLAELAAASVQGMVALGGTPGGRPLRGGQTSVDRGVPALGVCHARWEGFDLHAAVRVPAGRATGSSACAATRCARRWRGRGSAWRPMATCGCSCATRGPTARRT